MSGWQQYQKQLEGMNMSSRKEIKKSMYDPSLDDMIKDKLNEE